MTGEDQPAGEAAGGQGSHHGHGDVAPSPVEVDDSDVGAGAAPGVWVTGVLSVVLVLVAIFALG